MEPDSSSPIGETGETGEARTAPGTIWLRILPVAGIFLLAAAVRSIGFEGVFLSDGSTVFAAGDAWYHVHRGLYSFLNFPSVLTFDPCINYPDGAPVPHPPGYDLFVAGLARALGGSRSVYEHVAAWLPVALGALTTLPVIAVGTAVRNRATGLLAGLLYALFPVAVAYSRVGNADHHAAAGLLGAILLILYVRVIDAPSKRPGLVAVFTALALTRAAMLLTWHGSLLYLAIGELGLVAWAVFAGKTRTLVAIALGAAATAALIAPVLAVLPTPVGGAFSATELSWLHCLLFVVELAVAGTAALPIASLRGTRWKRVVAAVGVGLACAAAMLALPGMGENVTRTLTFLAASDAWGQAVSEHLPLFYSQGRQSLAAGLRWMGGFALFVPLAPLAFLYGSGPAKRASSLLCFAWSLVLGGLAIQQLRFGNDYAAVGSVAFATAVLGLAAPMQRRGVSPRWSRGILTAVVIVLVAPAVSLYHYPSAGFTIAYFRGALDGADRALQTIQGGQVRFAEKVKAALPPGEGCDGSGQVPSDGVMAHPALGHVLHYVADVATPSDPIGPYVGERATAESIRFLSVKTEEEALAIASEFGTRFVATVEDGSVLPGSLIQRLHREDGVSVGALPHVSRFRLLTEGPLEASSFSPLFSSDERPGVPYKLYEIVQGAVILATGQPGETVVASLPVVSDTGRAFVYRASAVAGEDGLARIRVAYESGVSRNAENARGYVVRSSAGQREARVSLDAVRSGAILYATISD